VANVPDKRRHRKTAHCRRMGENDAALAPLKLQAL
jgi:hypothetical protein